MIFIGIDPGKDGGMAVLGGSAIPYTFSFTKKTPADIWFEIACCETMKDKFCVIERVSARPAKNKEGKTVQGISSTFKFGYNAGMLEGFLVAACIPYEFVIPAKWQRYMGCLTGGDKKITYKKAQQLFPLNKITHSVADALLIAEYCKRKYNEYKDR